MTLPHLPALTPDVTPRTAAPAVPQPQGAAALPLRPVPARLTRMELIAEDFLNPEVRVVDPQDLPQPRVPSWSERCDDASCIQWRCFDPPPLTRALVHWMPAAVAGAVATYGAIEGQQDLVTFGVVGGVAWLALSTAFSLLCWR